MIKPELSINLYAVLDTFHFMIYVQLAVTLKSQLKACEG